MARHNAAIYKVAHKIEFIVGDIFKLYPKLRANVLFMSPPWGGPEYSRINYSLASMCSEQLACRRLGLFNVAKTIAPKIAFHMPKTTNVNEVSHTIGHAMGLRLYCVKNCYFNISVSVCTSIPKNMRTSRYLYLFQIFLRFIIQT